MMLLALSSAFVASPTVYARGSTTSVYALTQLQDTLLKIDSSTGKNSTVGKFALHDDYNPVATQLSAILGDRMYFLALNKTSMSTDLLGIELDDATVVTKMPTPLLQDASGEVGNGMTIHASKAGGLILTGLDSTGKHAAYRIAAPDHPAAVKLSDGFLATETMTLLDAAHCLDERNGTTVLWTIVPAANYSVSGLFDLVGVDLVAADPAKSELLRFTLPPAQMIHAMEMDDASGKLVALGIDASLHPFVFTFDPASRKAHAEASVDGYLVYNGMSAWDPATRTFYGLVETSESVPAPMLFGFSAATGAASAPVALCEGGYGCAVPFNIDVRAA